MHNHTIVIASVIALALRIISILILISVIFTQAQQFKIKSRLQPLKRYLVALAVLILLSNLPIIQLHLDRIYHGSSSAETTAFATITNALSMLLVSIVLYLIYAFKD